MALISIPVDYTKGNQTIPVDLEGTRYRLQFLWNARGLYWSLEVQQSDGTPIVSGIRVVSDYSLLSRYTSTALPPGRLFCLDTTREGTDPGAETLGVTHLMVYEESV